ncbi:MAG: hypothetical protein JWM00_540 [Candidatus Saccharibacteria bacterium]|nr:hypothetical protein [Candidatus Saccharibacteria bacterium]
MYSGSTFRTKSGRLMGVHQRIDRIARRHVRRYVPSSVHFPTTRDILHFEGKNGPDGIKRKNPGVDEPWHFIDPYHKGDHELFDMITDHILNLGVALKEKNEERAAFEAAWLAHAIVDGLTPAHHYPMEEKLEELRGEGLETRVSKKDKLVMPGATRRHQLRNNWEFWGAKGVMTTHIAFELGVASSIATLRFDDIAISDQELVDVRAGKYIDIYQQLLGSIAEMDMYKEFSRVGWTRHLASETKNTLMPLIIKAVVLGWYAAVGIAEETA